MLKNCDYNKTKLLHELSKTLGFIKRHAKEDAKEDDHKECAELYEALEKDLEKHVDKLRKAVNM